MSNFEQITPAVLLEGVTLRPEFQGLPDQLQVDDEYGFMGSRRVDDHGRKLARFVGFAMPFSALPGEVYNDHDLVLPVLDRKDLPERIRDNPAALLKGLGVRLYNTGPAMRSAAEDFEECGVYELTIPVGRLVTRALRMPRLLQEVSYVGLVAAGKVIGLDPVLDGVHASYGRNTAGVIRPVPPNGLKVQRERNVENPIPPRFLLVRSLTAMVRVGTARLRPADAV